jgi:CDP-diacylglycerol---serine O-phosphatidyltransferase
VNDMGPTPSLGASGGPGIPGIPGRSGRKRRRGVALLPSLFTLGNCLSGFASLNYAARGPEPGTDPVFQRHFEIAAYFIFLAMLFDMFDGFVARITRSASDFGAELDSLADMISFGVAPAFLSIHLIGELLRAPSATGKEYIAIPGPFQDNDWLRLFWIVACIYVSCTALRLARFNVITQPDPLAHMNFRGMPSPGAAAIVAGTVVFFEYLGLPGQVYFHVTSEVKESLKLVFPYLLPIMLLCAALLMVSRFSYAHLINRFLRGRKTFRKLVGFFLLVMLVAWEPQITVLLGIYLYAVSAPAVWIFRLMFRKPALPGLPIPTGSEKRK